MSKNTLNIGQTIIGGDSPCFIIAEAGVNHNGDVNLAFRLIDAAADAKANAVKFQTFLASELVSADAPKAEYQLDRTSKNESQKEMLLALELPLNSYSDLQKYANQKGLMFLSTPFDSASVDFLDSLGMPAFKVPSGEVTNVNLMRHIARKNKPMIVSTGMCEMSEVDSLFELLKSLNVDEIALLQCTSNYPAAPENINLRAMTTLASRFKVPVGLSDHSEGPEIAFASVAMGGKILEKHITLDRSLEGPDHAASMEPSEFSLMVAGIRKIELALGSFDKKAADSEKSVAMVARRSLVAARDLKEGCVLTDKDIICKRPGSGLSPASAHLIVGKVLINAVKKGHMFSLNDVKA